MLTARARVTRFDGGASDADGWFAAPAAEVLLCKATDNTTTAARWPYEEASPRRSISTKWVRMVLPG